MISFRKATNQKASLISCLTQPYSVSNGTWGMHPSQIYMKLHEG